MCVFLPALTRKATRKETVEPAERAAGLPPQARARGAKGKQDNRRGAQHDGPVGGAAVDALLEPGLWLFVAAPARHARRRVFVEKMLGGARAAFAFSG